MKLVDMIREKRSMVVFMVVMMAAFLYMMRPFILTMLLASIIAVMVFPLYSRVNKFCGGKRRLAALFSTLLVFFILILPTTLIVTVLINQIYHYVGSLDLKQTFSEIFSTNFYVLYIDPVITRFENRFNVSINIFGVLSDFGKNVAGYITSYSPAVLARTAGFIFDFFLTLVGIYFLLLEGPALLRVLFDLSPLRETHEQRLSKRFKDTVDASIYGYLVTGVIQGIIAGIIYAIVGVKGFLILAVLTFFTSMVPLVGAAGVWVPVCVWLFLQGQMWQGVVMLIGGMVVSLIDNFIKPLVIQGRAKIHPLLIFFSLFGGIQLFGPLGILFGPVITALLIASITIYREEMVAK